VKPDPDDQPPDDAIRDRIGREYPSLRRIIAAHVHKTCNPKHAEMFIDEVIQDTVYQALKAAARFDPSRPLIPWLMGFAINILKAKKRIIAIEHKRFAHQGEIDDRIWEGLISFRRADDRDGPEKEATRAKIQDALGRLDVASRKAIYFRFLEGLEGQELAQALGVRKSGTARVRTYRAVRKLKGLLLSGARELVPTEEAEEEAP
jgi:RNA polymerase sigma factor (sigma-70 family)